MDPRLLRYYSRELQFIREMGGEFAAEFPKIAGRLGLEGFECADPYVERLLEGFAFLAGRVQLKMDAEFPEFTQHLLEVLYPHYLAPTPSMAVVQFQPKLSEGALAEGFTLPRQTILRSILGKGERTACEYRTAREVQLWPLELVAADYLATAATVASHGVNGPPETRAALRLRLRTTAGLGFHETALERLPLFLRGPDELPMHLYEQLIGNGLGLVIRPAGTPEPWQLGVHRSQIRRLGFADSEALLPFGARSFHGYRLLQEYFAFPGRFLFVDLGGLGPAVRRCQGQELEVFVLLSRSDPLLAHGVSSDNFGLFCAPAVNLFPKRADRIHLSEQSTEYHLVPDRTRPLDYEVYQVTEVRGYGTAAEQEQSFLPFYAFEESAAAGGPTGAYYSVHREPRVLSERQRQHGPRSSYVGNEVFLSLVDAEQAPYRSTLRQLGVEALCTNRDLPLQMPVGKSNTDFTLESGAPVASVRCLAGPTPPRPSRARGEAAWRLISHLSLNYLTLMDTDPEQGAAALRELLGLYAEAGEAAIRKQIEGLRSVTAVPVTRRLPTPGPITFGRGLEVTVTFEESAFEGSGVFLLGAVLAHFFTRYVSLNSFTETVIRTVGRGEIMRWPVQPGRRQTL